jgi:hypothetical protein
MPLTLRNSEEQAMFDAIMIAGWEIVEEKLRVFLVSPSGIPFAVYLREYRPLIYDIFDTFTHYNYFR